MAVTEVEGLVGRKFRDGQYVVTGIDKKNSKKMVVKCLKCGRLYSLDIGYVLKGVMNPCKTCRWSNRWIGKIVNGYEILGRDFNNKCRVLVKCKECGKLHSVQETRLYDGKCNPCECRQSNRSHKVIEIYSGNYQYKDGKYTIVGRDKIENYRYKTILKCNRCGRVYRVNESSVLNMKSNPCKCNRKINYVTVPGLKYSYIGRVFREGRYTVVRRDTEHKFKGHAIRYIVECNRCGREYSVQDSKIIKESANPCKVCYGSKEKKGRYRRYM